MSRKNPFSWPIHLKQYDPEASFLAWVDTGAVHTYSYAELLKNASSLAGEVGSEPFAKPGYLPRNERTPQQAILASTHLLAGVPFVLSNEPEPRANEPETRANEAETSKVNVANDVGSTSAIDDVIITLETSGTTGKPKRVDIAATQINHAVRHLPAPMRTMPGEYWGHALPLQHVGGVSILARALSTGGGVAFAIDTSVESIQELLTSIPLKGISLVATQLQRLLNHAESVYRLSALDAIILGGGPLPLEVAEQALAHDLPVYQSYGMTETFAMIAAHRLSDTPDQPQCIGKPFGDTQIMLHNGTLHLRGTQIGAVSTGTDLAGQTSEAKLVPNAWFDTGDLGRQDSQGRWIIEARRDDLILSGGNNIFPPRLEQAIARHPDIEAAIVLGVDDPEWGQRVVAIVEPKPAVDESTLQSTLHEDALEAWIKKQNALRSYEYPKEWIVLPMGQTIPRTTLGKLARKEATSLLRDR
jgi:O-succinylbenzoic acid--CoA ligase